MILSTFKVTNPKIRHLLSSIHISITITMTCWSLIDFDVFEEGGKTECMLQDIVKMSVQWRDQKVSEEVKCMMMTDFIVVTSQGEDVGILDFDTVFKCIKDNTHDAKKIRPEECKKHTT